MGSVIEFPTGGTSRRPGSTVEGTEVGAGTVLILPVIRIERQPEGNSDGGPEEGAAPGRRRRRR